MLLSLLCHGAVPTIDELSSVWIDSRANASTAAALGPEQVDLATINNFHGAVGIAPQQLRPVDMIGVNSLELPPFAACGGSAARPYGCGRLLVDGVHVAAAATRWATHEAGRRSAPLANSGGVVVSSATRMPFEQHGVMWELNFTNPATTAAGAANAANATIRVDIELSAAARQYETVGTWVYNVPADADAFPYTPFADFRTGLPRQRGVHVCRPRTTAANASYSDAACARYVVSGPLQPDAIAPAGAPVIPAGAVPTATFSALTIAPGATATVRLSLAVGGTLNEVETAQRKYGGSAAAFDAAWAAARDLWQQRWEQAFAPGNGFWSGSLPSIELADGADGDDGAAAPSPSSPAATAASAAAGVARVFYMSCLTVISQCRTNLPLIHAKVWPNGNGNAMGLAGGGAKGGGIGVGGSRSWWWDEALTSLMLALLEPAGRAPTFQAWLAHDDHDGTAFGHGMGNGYAMDCAPLGSSAPFGTGTCGMAPHPGAVPGGVRGGSGSGSGGGGGDGGGSGAPTALPEYGFYCYNPWAYYMTASNHLRVNNDSAFLHARAANSSVTVEGALLGIATDWQHYLIPGTQLVDYGPDMDGFSPTYKHVMAGCSQGNNAWMLRDFASYRAAQGRATDAAELRRLAAGIVKDTMGLMYQSEGGHGWFNLIHPSSANASAPPPAAADAVTRHEMRHVVDFFSVTFGLCGLADDDGGDQICDFSPQQRRELGAWFRGESVTRSWVRATSPTCNCNNSAELPYPPLAAAAQQPAGAPSQGGPSAVAKAAAKEEVEPYPGLTTCKADRSDHGTTGAYPSWPAFALEALCYLDGNCTSAFAIMGSFAENTHQGPFGQSQEVPQLLTPPYTPLNDELAFKPTKGVNRYVAIEGGAFFDAILRGFFGYHAPLQWGPTGGGAGAAQRDLDAALSNAAAPRGFSGRLANLRTPHGLVTITADAATGLSVRVQ
jgi:hypothetical protein